MNNSNSNKDIVSFRLEKRALVAVIAFSILFTMLSVQWSFDSGRLAFDPSFDDVGYFNDALERVGDGFSNGVLSSMKSLWDIPPHSPFSTGIGMIALSLFGPVEWGFYAANVVIVFFFFGLISCVSGWSKPSNVLLLIFGVSFVPISRLAVTEFRPDIAVGLATAITVALIASDFASRKDGCGPMMKYSGVALGAALLIKPTFFMHTFAISGFAIFLGVLIQYFKTRSVRHAFRRFLTALIYCYGIGGLIASVYYLRSYRRIWSYFSRHTGGGADAYIWKLKGSLFDAIVSYTLGPEAQSIVGVFLWLFLGLALLGVCVFALQKRYEAFVFASITLAAGMASLMVLAYGRMANSQFAATYIMLVICSGVFALTHCFNRIPSNVVVTLFALICLGGTAFSRVHSVNFGRDESITGDWNARIVREIRNDWGGLMDPLAEIPVFVAFVGYVNGSTMRWESLKAGVGLNFLGGDETWGSGSREELAETAIEKMENAAYVVIADADSDSIMSFMWHPANQARDLVNAAVIEKFEEIPLDGESTSEAPFRIFRNRRVAERLGRGHSVEIGFPSKGFYVIEGPYPQWKLPYVRWGIFPESEIALRRAVGQAISVSFEARAESGVIMTCYFNDEIIDRHEFISGDFEKIAFHIASIRKPGLLELKYSKAEGGFSDGDRAVLFQNIEIAKVAPREKPNESAP